MSDYSLWKQGRDASGKIVSMEPHTCPGNAAPLGVLELPFRALEVIAELGQWYEQHQMRKLQEAQFAERRHRWMRNILSQWAEEHRNRHSIRIDVTQAVGDESHKMFNDLVENKRADVPQTLLVYSARMADLFDEATAFFGKTINVVKKSGEEHVATYPVPDASGRRARKFKDKLFYRSRGGFNAFMERVKENVEENPWLTALVGWAGPIISGEMTRKKLRRVAYTAKNYMELVRLRFAAYNLVEVTKEFRKTMETRDVMEHVFARKHNDHIQIASVDDSQTASPPGGVRTIDLTTS